MNQWDQLWLDINIATMDRASHDCPYGAIHDGAIAVKDGKIAWVGKRTDLPEFDVLTTPTHQGHGAWVTPGLIDCHTHIVYAGNRAEEFEQRLNGVSYEEIARQGGGILSTVNATRQASEESLYASAKNRLYALMREGVTTVEIKSGYGLDTANEIKMLKVARLLGEHLPITITTTFLGAHAVPPEYKDNADGYINLLITETMPAVVAENLADAVDVFCENIGFSEPQTQLIFIRAKMLGLPVKCHAEQLSNIGGTALCSLFRGLSSDHLEYLDDYGAAGLRDFGTVAVLLPGPFYYLREKQLPPIDLLNKYNVPIAIGSDTNPGSSPLCSLLLMLNMACTLFKMTPEQALTGVTKHAARAVGMLDRGMLKATMRADFVLWDISHPAELAYQFGMNRPKEIIIAGQIQKPL